MLTRKIVILLDSKYKIQSMMYLNLFKTVKTFEYVHHLTFLFAKLHYHNKYRIILRSYLFNLVKD